MTESGSENPNFKNTDQENGEFEENEITAIPPQLYSKGVILAFSVLFSTIFGAVILMSNMKRLQKTKGRLQVLLFGIIYSVGQVFTLNSFESTNMSIPLNIIGGVVLNEYFWNRYIGKEREYLKKSWLKPAIISGLITIPFLLGIFFLAEK